MTRLARLVEQRFRLVDTEKNPDAVAPADARRSWGERHALVLVVEDDEGRVGLGEASPLPDYSPDTLDDAWNALSPLVGTRLGERELGASGSSRELLGLTAALASPAARFGLESALLDLWSRRRGEPAWSLLSRIGVELAGTSDDPDVARDGCAVATLLPGGADAALREARRAHARDIRCFKLKIGAPGAWSEELAALRAIRQNFPDVALRVDANQSLSPGELCERLPALRELALEWLEEPTASFPGGIEVPLGVPVALDESLQGSTPDPVAARQQGVGAYVLKPTALGGFVRSLELARGARSAGLGVVTSHIYEGPLGFSAIAALSLALGAGRPADGLDRHAGVGDGAALPAFDAARGRLRAWSEPGFGLPFTTLLERGERVREVP